MVDGDRIVPVDPGAHVEPVALAESGPGEGADQSEETITNPVQHYCNKQKNFQSFQL